MEGLTEIVIMAADTNPLEMLMNIPTICEEKVFIKIMLIMRKYQFFLECSLLFCPQSKCFR